MVDMPFRSVEDLFTYYFPSMNQWQREEERRKNEALGAAVAQRMIDRIH